MRISDWSSDVCSSDLFPSHDIAAKGDTSAGSYTAPTISGRIGLVTGGVDGNAAMTSGSTTPGATGGNNPPYLVVNYIIKYQ